MHNIHVRTIEHTWNSIPGRLTWFFIGQPKTRKTSAAAGWSPNGKDGVLLIDTDLGADLVAGANVVTVTSFNPPTRPLLQHGKQVTKDAVPQTEVIPPKERGFYHRSGPQQGQILPVYSLAEVLQWLKANWDGLPYDTVVIDTVDQMNT